MYSGSRVAFLREATPAVRSRTPAPPVLTLSRSLSLFLLLSCSSGYLRPKLRKHTYEYDYRGGVYTDDGPIVNFRFRSYTAARACRRNGADTFPMVHDMCRHPWTSTPGRCPVNGRRGWVLGNASLWELRLHPLPMRERMNEFVRTSWSSRSHFNRDPNKREFPESFIDRREMSEELIIFLGGGE